MIWGCITYNGIGTLCFVEGNINAEKYINIIDTNLWPVIARHFPQDNCVSRRQCTRTSGTYSQRVHSENNINHMEWPTQSPDLNVIENRWWKLKRDLENEVHLITSVNDLQMAIRRVWENIPVDFIRNCMIQYLGD
jgi:hypothetical protein